jgi:hypothetical protein
MATQTVSPRSSQRFPIHPVTPTRKRLLQQAEELFELIGAHIDAGSVDDLRMLHALIGQFLLLPPDVLRKWDES